MAISFSSYLCHKSKLKLQNFISESNIFPSVHLQSLALEKNDILCNSSFCLSLILWRSFWNHMSEYLTIVLNKNLLQQHNTSQSSSIVREVSLFLCFLVWNVILLLRCCRVCLTFCWDLTLFFGLYYKYISILGQRGHVILFCLFCLLLCLISVGVLADIARF